MAAICLYMNYSYFHQNQLKTSHYNLFCKENVLNESDYTHDRRIVDGSTDIALSGRPSVRAYLGYTFFILKPRYTGSSFVLTL